MFQTRRFGLALLAFVMGGVVACDDTVTESDLQKWTNNEVGLRRIKDVVIDAQQPSATRVRALEVMVEKGRGMEMRVRTMVDAIADEADRQQIMRGIGESLVRHVEEARPSLLGAKDALMMSARFLEPELLERARKAIATWAFTDIDWNLTPDTLREKIQSRMSTGQIVDLGNHGYEAAAILIANAFNVEQMTRFLVDAKDPRAHALVVKGLRALHAREAPTGFQLDALSRVVHPEAAAYLLELSRSSVLEPDLADAAYSFALSLYRNKDLPDATSARSAAVASILGQLGTASPGDRWYFARNVVELSAGAKLGEALRSFPDDKRYGEGEEDPAKSIMDFALDFADLADTAQHVPTLSMMVKDGNRVQKAIAILCAKAAELSALTPELTALAEQIEKETDVDLSDLLGEGVTLGTLARNTLEGLAMMSEARAAMGAGKYTKEQFDSRKFLIVVEYEASGDTYKANVEAEYNTWLESLKPKENKPEPGTKAGAAPEKEPVAVEATPPEKPASP